MTYRDDVKDLKQYYKFVYKCKKCGQAYGSDKEDKSRTCPRCEGKRYY